MTTAGVHKDRDFLSKQSPHALKLSAEQQEIISYRGGHLQVIACAGSGKTESISRRVASLISEGENPEAIIAFTFTEKAAAELKERIYQRVEEVKGTDFLGRLAPMFVGTIHGYCFRLLQNSVPKFGNYDVLDEHRHTALVSRRRYELELHLMHPQHWKSIDKFLLAADVIGNELIDSSKLGSEMIGKCYGIYRDLLERYRFLTFGLIISQAVEVLRNDKTVYDRIHANLRHLIVDEYQDINPAQEALIELLAKKPVQLCVVGDDDQAIYQWRGSDVGNILHFTKRYKTVKTVKLETNRRSRPHIVKCANTFALTIPLRLDKKMNAERPTGKAEVIPWLAETDHDEAEIIANHIDRLHKNGWKYRDIAVLYRSVKTSAPPLVHALEERGIPFNCGGRTGLFAHPLINHFGELFAWMADFSWQDERFGPSRQASIDQVVNGLSAAFTLSSKKRKELMDYFLDWKKWHAKGNRRVSLVGDFYAHLNLLGVDQIDPDTPQGSARLGSLARFSKLLADYESVTLRSRWIVSEEGDWIYVSGKDRGKDFWTGLANYMVHYARESYEDFEGEEIHDLDAVSILTVHQAKGLEWPILFIPALTNRRFPSSMSGRAQEWALPEKVFPLSKRARYEGTDGDERRLFYVAMTRARDILYASSFQRLSRSVGTSPYLIEVAASVGLTQIPNLESLPMPDKPEKMKNDRIPPFEIGFSDLALHEDCGYAYRLSHVYGFDPELVQELGYGRAVHHVLRHIAEHAKTKGRIPNAREVEDVIKRELYVPFANESTFRNMQRNVHLLVNKYIEEWSDDLRRVWDTERPFEIHFDRGILKGRADIILDEEGGHINNLAIVDYKTSSDQDRDERYAKQLTIYAAAGQQEGLDIRASYLHELKLGRRTSIDISDDNRRRVIAWANARSNEICLGRYPAKPEQNKCDRCDYKLICKHNCSYD